jgi:hypothetical protein
MLFIHSKQLLMHFKNYYYSFLVILFTGTLFPACKKKELAERKVDVAGMIQAYEEIGRRHNDFLAKSFPKVKERLKQRNMVTKATTTISEGEVYDVLMEVSSENLVPVLEYPYSSQQLLTELQQNLPQDLVFQEYPTTLACLQAFIPETIVSPTFEQALQELDLLLEQCTDYSNTAGLVQSFDQLREKYIPALSNAAELESLIAGCTLGKHSLSYWAENEQVVMEMFRDVTMIKATGLKSNVVKADVQGIVVGGIRGAVSGAAWGAPLLGIGAIWGGITFGIFTAAYQGCVASLGAGLWHWITR